MSTLRDDYKEILKIYCNCLTELETPTELKSTPLPHVEDWLHIGWIRVSSRRAEAVVICNWSGDVVVRGSPSFKCVGLPLIPLRNTLLSARYLSRTLRSGPYMTELTEKYAILKVNSPEFEAILTEARLA